MPPEEEDENVRYAVARDEEVPPAEGKNEPTVKRAWWGKNDRFDADWDSRKLFDHRPEALALIWKQRSDNRNHPRYKFHLIKVVRSAAPLPNWLP